MKFSFTNKLKIFVISVLVILVAGMALLGILGFNQTVDNKQSFEMQVSLDQNIEDAKETFKQSAESAIKANGVAVENYSFQEMNDGFVLVYKLNAGVDEATRTAIETQINEALQTFNIKSEVKILENLGDYSSQTLMTLLAVGIAVVVIFIYALIMNKLAGGVAVICSSVLSALLFTALMAIARIPAQPYFAVLVSGAVALASALSLALTTKYKALLKNNDKASGLEITQNVNKSLFGVFIALAVALALIAVMAGVIGLFNSLFLGLAILLAGVSSLASAIYMTPLMWIIIKGNKN